MENTKKLASISNRKYVLHIIKTGDTVNVTYYDNTSCREVINIVEKN